MFSLHEIDVMRFLNALFGFLLIPALSSAQMQVKNLEELLRYADKNGPAAKQAMLQPKLAKQDVKLTASNLLPRVNAFATGDYYPILITQVIPGEAFGRPPGEVTKVQFGLPYVFTAGTEFSMPVIDLGKWAQLKRSKTQYAQAQWGSKAALEDYHIQLMQAYYQVLVNREVLRLNRENVTITDELIRVMDARLQAGVINPADFNRSKNLQLDVRTADLSYNRMLEQSINALKNLLAANGDLTIIENIGDYNWPVVSTPASIANRAAWNEAKFNIRAAELAVAEASRGGLPRLGVAGRYTYNYQTKFQDDFDPAEFSMANVGLRLDVPLFQGNYYRALKQKNQLLLDAAHYEQEQTEAQLTRQQADWFAQYTEAFKKNEELKEKVTASGENLKIANLSMREGVMEFDEYNEIFREYNRARIEYLQNLADGILYHLLSTQKF
ncbi:MAG: hypothetical protein K0R82_1301 [Flavipsychrobacter sp.]|jgi:outer membrane protein TolC|nr:hypothetical protein [Flavipsychrobacter sp.]